METIAETGAGAVRGTAEGALRIFKGVPYAAAPIGANRFRAPRRRTPWSGVRDALTFGPRPWQPEAPPDIAAMLCDPSVAGEDCLTANIWTPAARDGRLPVMVWIPGGAFEFGSGAAYDGSRFARDGVVCVTINYRVGAEGFLYFGPGAANFGLLDQVAALAWVRENIAAFGGDAENVTVFGQSAGAMSIGALLAMPAARGLFRRAILQSGGPTMAMPAATGEKTARALAAKLGVPLSQEALAQVPPARVLEAQTAVKAEMTAAPDPNRWGIEAVTTLMPLHPVIDGELLPAAPLDRIAAGASANIDVIAGWNNDDWRLFTLANGLMGVTDDVLLGPVAIHGFKCLAAYGLDAGEALAAHRAAKPGASAFDVLAAAQTDWWCRGPALRLAEARLGAQAATYVYEFAWPSPAGGGMLGACHALEIPFVFDTLDKGAAQMMGPLLGDAPPQALADAMHGSWVRFAKTGEAGWPKFDGAHRTTMRFVAP